MRSLFILFLALSLTGCQLVHRIRTDETKKIDSNPFTDVTLRYATALKYEKNLNLEDSFVCFEEGKAKTVRLDFTSQDIISLCQARFLLVDLVEGFLKELNRAEEALTQNPKGHFTANDLEIYIHYDSDYVDYVDTAYIGWIRLKDGVSVFYAADIGSYSQDFWQSRQEPYEKSLEIATVMRDAESDYRATHHVQAQRSFFGDHDFSSNSWFSGKSVRERSGVRSFTEAPSNRL
jgi:hypothetical protein